MSAVAASAVLADEAQKSGPIGLAVILLLCIACYFLFKSMSKHIRRAREHLSPDESATPPEQARSDQPGTDGAARPGADLRKRPSGGPPR